MAQEAWESANLYFIGLRRMGSISFNNADLLLEREKYAPEKLKADARTIYQISIFNSQFSILNYISAPKASFETTPKIR